IPGGESVARGSPGSVAGVGAASRGDSPRWGRVAMTPETRRELERLLSALCEGELPDARHTRLQELLRADSECRRLYREYLDLHARLLCSPRPVGASPHPGVESARERGGPLPRSPSRPSEGRSPHGGRWNLRQPFRYALVAVLTLAATLVVQHALV